MPPNPTRIAVRLCALALLMAAGCAAPAVRPPLPPQRFADPTAAPTEDSPAAARLAAALPNVAETLKAFAGEHHLPSLAAGVVYRGRLVWSGGFGEQPPNADTVFRIGSITKVLAGLGLLALRDQGVLDLDDPVARWLPEIGRVLYPTRDSPRITLRHLVTHSSGLPRVGALDYTKGDHDVTEAEIFRALDGARLEFAPGTRTSYSNLAVALLGPILTRASGRPFQAFLREKIFAPLGMTSTVWRAADVPPGRLSPGHLAEAGHYRTGAPLWRLGAAGAMGGLYSTVNDLARFVAFELAAWPPRSAPDPGPVERATVRESQRVAGPSEGSGGFGVGWVVRDDPALGWVVGHDGATPQYSAGLLLLPSRGLGLILLLDTGEYALLDELGGRVLTQLSAAVAPPAPVLDEAARAGLAHLKALLASPDEATAKASIAPAFLARLGLPRLLGLMAQVHALAGACHDETVEATSGPGVATVTLRCERARIRAELHAAAAPPHLLEGLLLRPAP